MSDLIVHPQVNCDWPSNNPSDGLWNALGYYTTPSARTGSVRHEWTTCRSGFQSVFKCVRMRKSHTIPSAYRLTTYGRHANNLAENAARWFWYVEGHMGWWDRTQVHPTQYPNVLQFKLSGGWWNDPMAFSLMTLFLRIAPNCAPGSSIDSVLRTHSYSQTTKPAIWRFLEGNHIFIPSNPGGVGNGWVAKFQQCTDEIALTHLVPKHVVDEEARKAWERGGRREGFDAGYWEQGIAAVRGRIQAGERF